MKATRILRGQKIACVEQLDNLTRGRNKTCGLCGEYLSTINTSEWEYFNEAGDLTRQCTTCEAQEETMVKA